MPPKASTTTEANGPSPRESELALFLVKCLKSKPEVDYEKLATLGSYKNVKSARDNMNKLFAKFVEPSTKGGEDGTKGGKVSLAKRKTASTDDTEENADEETPKKKAKATPKKGKKGSKAASEEASEVKAEVDEEA